MAVNFLAGGLGGITSTVIGHPFDTVKVRMQTMALLNGRPVYTGMGDCIFKTLQLEGVYGLFRGVSAPVAGIVPTFALSYASYGVCQSIVKQIYRGADYGLEEEGLSIPEHFLAGALSAFPTNILASPINRVKCLLQVQGPHSGQAKPLYSGAADCVVKLVRGGGYASLNKGWQITLLRDIPASSVFFGSYQLGLKTWLPADPEEISQAQRVLAVMLSGGTAGVMWSVVAHPLDTVKSRIQISEVGTFESWKGIVEATRVIIKEGGGVKGLYKGITPSIARGFPANVAMFLSIEITKWFFGQSDVLPKRSPSPKLVYSECQTPFSQKKKEAEENLTKSTKTTITAS